MCEALGKFGYFGLGTVITPAHPPFIHNNLQPIPLFLPKCERGRAEYWVGTFRMFSGPLTLNNKQRILSNMQRLEVCFSGNPLRFCTDAQIP